MGRKSFERICPDWMSLIVNESSRKLGQNSSVARNQFGRPLRETLKGYRRLRVGDYRVIYRVDSKTTSVLIVMVMHRRTKYKGVKSRISKKTN